jgi:hypothetical protein
MKTLAPQIQVIEVPGEGFDALLGQIITVFCAVYIYTGKLVGNNSDFIKLEDPKIVYETGPFDTKEWRDAQVLPYDFYIQKSMIESFGILK